MMLSILSMCLLFGARFLSSASYFHKEALYVVVKKWPTWEGDQPLGFPFDLGDCPKCFSHCQWVHPCFGGQRTGDRVREDHDQSEWPCHPLHSTETSHMHKGTVRHSLLLPMKHPSTATLRWAQISVTAVLPFPWPLAPGKNMGKDRQKSEGSRINRWNGEMQGMGRVRDGMRVLELELERGEGETKKWGVTCRPTCIAVMQVWSPRDLQHGSSRQSSRWDVLLQQLCPHFLWPGFQLSNWHPDM